MNTNGHRRHHRHKKYIYIKLQRHHSRQGHQDHQDQRTSQTQVSRPSWTSQTSESRESSRASGTIKSSRSSQNKYQGLLIRIPNTRRRWTVQQCSRSVRFFYGSGFSDLSPDFTDPDLDPDPTQLPAMLTRTISKKNTTSLIKSSHKGNQKEKNIRP